MKLSEEASRLVELNRGGPGPDRDQKARIRSAVLLGAVATSAAAASAAAGTASTVAGATSTAAVGTSTGAVGTSAAAVTASTAVASTSAAAVSTTAAVFTSNLVLVKAVVIALAIGGAAVGTLAVTRAGSSSRSEQTVPSVVSPAGPRAGAPTASAPLQPPTTAEPSAALERAAELEPSTALEPSAAQEGAAALSPVEAAAEATPDPVPDAPAHEPSTEPPTRRERTATFKRPQASPTMASEATGEASPAASGPPGPRGGAAAPSAPAPVEAPTRNAAEEGGPRRPSVQVSVNDELKQLAKALRSIDEARSGEALETLARYEQDFPHGAMRVEAQALKVRALCAAGELEAGTALARSLLHGAASSPAVRALRSTCAAAVFADSP